MANTGQPWLRVLNPFFLFYLLFLNTTELLPLKKIRNYTLTLAAMIILAPRFAGGMDPQWEGNAMVWGGINAFYNYEFENAVKILSTARKQYPAHPSVHFTWAVSKWLKARAHDGVEESYAVLLQSLDEVIPVYEDLMHRFPHEPHYELYLFSAVGLKARVHLGRKGWLSVILQGIRGYRGVASVHRENPELWDAYLPMGMLNFYTGISSPIVRFLAGLLGIEGDRDVGMDQIQVAAEKGEFSWIEANLTLIFVHLWIDDDYEESLPLARKMRDLFPASIYNQHLYAESLIRVGRLDEAEENLRQTFKLAEDLPEVARKGWIPTLKYQKALLEFYRGKYDTSLVLVTASIEEFQTELDTPLSFGYVLRGNIYDLKGQRLRAIRDYRAALALDNYSSAMRHAREYLRKPFGTEE